MKHQPRNLKILSFICLYFCLSLLANSKHLNIPMKILSKHEGQSRMAHRIPLRHSHYFLRQFHGHLRSQFHLHRLHQLHFAETYSLQARDMFFGLALKIQSLEYLLSIDTGSSDFMIKGQGTSGEPKIKYQCKECEDNRPHYRLGYLDGDLDTYEQPLEVQLGQHLFKQSVLVAYRTENNNFQDDDGIVGLSYQKLAENPNPNFISTLIDNRIIDQYAFGVNLNFKNKDNSLINFGKFDQTLFQGELGFFDIESSSQYLINMKGISVGDSKGGYTKVMSINQGLLDTGNTCLSIPNQYESQILKKISGDSDNQSTGNNCYFQVEENIEMFSIMLCRVTNFQALPNFNIHVGQLSYSIPKQFYLQYCSKRPQYERYLYDDQAWYCQTYIETMRNMDQAILGDVFFTRFYTYFDLEAKKIGIAQNKQQINITAMESDFELKSKDWAILFPQYQNDKQESLKSDDSLEESAIQSPFASFFQAWF